MKLDFSQFAKAAAQAYAGYQSGKLAGMQYKQQQEQQDFSRQMQVFPMLANLEQQQRENTLEPYRTALNAPDQTTESRQQAFSAYQEAQQRLGQGLASPDAFRQFVGGNAVGQRAFQGIPQGQVQLQGQLPAVPRPQMRNPDVEMEQKSVLAEIDEMRGLALQFGEPAALSALAGLGSKVFRKELDPRTARAELSALSAPLLEQIRTRRKEADDAVRLSKAAQLRNLEADNARLDEGLQLRKQAEKDRANDLALKKDFQNVKAIEDAFSTGTDPKTTRELIKRQRAYALSPEGQKHGLVPYGGEVFGETPRKIPTKFEVQAFEQGTKNALRRLAGEGPQIELVDGTRDETPEEIDARQLSEIASRINEGPAKRRYLEAGLNGLKSLLASSRWDSMSNPEREGVIESGNALAEQLGLPQWLPSGLKANTLPPKVQQELDLKKKTLVERKRAVDESIRYHDALIRQADARIRKQGAQGGQPGSPGYERKQQMQGLREQLGIQMQELSKLNAKDFLQPSQEQRVKDLTESTKQISDQLKSLWSSSAPTGADGGVQVFPSRGALTSAMQGTAQWQRLLQQGLTPTEIVNAYLKSQKYRIGAR